MIFSTQNQVYCFLIFLFFGIVLGFIYSIYKTIFLLNFQKIISKNIFFTIFYAIFIVFFNILINFFNFGKTHIALLIVYILGFSLIKRLLKNLLVFLENKWYTIINKILLVKIKKLKIRKRNNNERSKKS